MRISDWSSDVCSSDLAEWKSPSAVDPSPHHAAAIRVSPLAALAMAQPTACGYCVARFPEMEKKLASLLEYMIGNCLPCNRSARLEDRKSVEKGKSVSVRLDLGGRRIIKQKKST